MLHNTAGALSFTTASLSHPDLQRLSVSEKIPQVLCAICSNFDYSAWIIVVAWSCQ